MTTRCHANAAGPPARRPRRRGRDVRAVLRAGGGDWRPFADLRFSLAPSGDGLVDFDPVANQLPGLEQPSVAALREPSCRRARASR